MKTLGNGVIGLHVDELKDDVNDDGDELQVTYIAHQYVFKYFFVGFSTTYWVPP